MPDVAHLLHPATVSAAHRPDLTPHLPSHAATHIEETLSTLTYAARAKNIRNQPAVQVGISWRTLCLTLLAGRAPRAPCTVQPALQTPCLSLKLTAEPLPCPPLPPPQVDPEQAALTELRREIKLLRTENAYLREQLFQASPPRGQVVGGGMIGAGGGVAVSRLPSSHGQPPGTPGAGGALLLAGGATAGGPAPATGDGSWAAAAGTRPAAGAAVAGASSGGPAAAGGAGGSAPSPEDMMRRLLETQRMLVQFSR